jgi:hypothetical protein
MNIEKFQPTNLSLSLSLANEAKKPSFYSDYQERVPKSEKKNLLLHSLLRGSAKIEAKNICLFLIHD